MGVSSKNVSQSAPGGGDPWTILAIASDSKKTKERLAQLEAAELRLKAETEKNAKAIAALGTFNTIGQVLDEAKETLENARDEAFRIIETARQQAEEDADRIRSSHDEKALELSEREERVREREVEAGRKERRIGPLHKAAQEDRDRAKTELSIAEKARVLYESRLTKLKEAMREAMK